MKKLLSFILVLSLLAANLVIPTRAADFSRVGTIVEQGYCSDDVYWVLDENGLLYIYPTYRSGGMENNEHSQYGWTEFADQIRTVIMEEGITSIGTGSFNNLHYVTYIQVPSTVTRIHRYAFSNCTNLVKLVLCGDAPNTSDIYALSDDAFYGLKVPVSYPADNPTWTESVMNSYRFYCDSELTFEPYTELPEWPIESPNIPVPDIVEDTGSNGLGVYWNYCRGGKLRIFTKNGDQRHMDSNMDYTPAWYKHRINIKTVQVDEGILSIGEKAFDGYNNLTTVTLPATLTAIKQEAFDNCTALTAIDIPDNVTTIGQNAFFYCVSLERVTLGAGLKTLEPYAFYSCLKVPELALPDSLETIGEMALACCSALTELTIPASVKKLDRMALASCTGLQRVTFTGDAPEFGSDVFYEDSLVCYYPADNPTWTADVMENYGGRVAWVPAGAELTGLELVSGPVNTAYAVGDTVDLSGIKAIASYSNGTRQELGAESLTVEDGALTEVGVKNIQASYQGMSVSFPVYVHSGRTEVVLDSSLYPESEHQYGLYLEDVQTVTYPGAASLTLVFSADTKVELNYDFIYVSDKDYVTHGYYTGTQAAGVSITVPGDTAHVMLESDGTYTAYGYAFDSITATIIEHDYVDGVCSVCGEGGGSEPSPEPDAPIRGDVNGDGAVTSDDALHLLYHSLFGSLLYPIDQDCDFDRNGSVDSDDALYLLYHSLFGDTLYPLN